MKNTYKNEQIKSKMRGVHVILTNDNDKIANIARISDVEAMDVNDLILDIVIGYNKNSKDGIFVNFEGDFYKIHFEIAISDVSKELLQTCMAINNDVVDADIFEFCRYKDVVKQVRKSNNVTGAFLDWYCSDRKTHSEILAYDGIWFNGTYLRVLPVIPPSVGFNISGKLFEIFNDFKPITSIGNYPLYIEATDIKAQDGHWVNYKEINGIVIPDLEKISEITNEKIVAVDKKNGEEFVIYLNEQLSQNSSVIA